MPSTSLKQKRFMAAAAHNPEFAANAGIPQSVAEEFHNADTGKYGHKSDDNKRKIAKALIKRK
jgi:hypothetical protein